MPNICIQLLNRTHAAFTVCFINIIVSIFKFMIIPEVSRRFSGVRKAIKTSADISHGGSAFVNVVENAGVFLSSRACFFGLRGHGLRGAAHCRLGKFSCIVLLIKRHGKLLQKE